MKSMLNGWKFAKFAKIVHAKYNTFAVYYDIDSMAKHSSCKLIYNGQNVNCE